MKLQPMNVGEILDHTFKIYGEQFRSYLAITALGQVAVLVILLIFELSIPPRGFLFLRTDLPFLISLVITLVTCGAIVKKASLQIVDQSISVVDSYRFSLRRTGRMFAAGLLVWLAVVGGSILLIIPGIYLFVRYALFLQTLIIENRGAAGALSRSRKLVRGTWWRVFGILLLIGILVGVLMGVIEVPLSLVFLHRVLTEHIGATVTMQFVGSIVNIFATPFYVIAPTLLYYDLRIRKENLDLETMVDNLTGGPVDAVQA